MAYAAASNVTSAEREHQGRGSRISTTNASTNWPKRPSASYGRPLASAPPQPDPCAPSRPNAVGEHWRSSSPYWRLLHQHPKGLRRPRQVITSTILLLILGITLPLKREQVGKVVQLGYGLARSKTHPQVKSLGGAEMIPITGGASGGAGSGLQARRSSPSQRSATSAMSEFVGFPSAGVLRDMFDGDTAGSGSADDGGRSRSRSLDTTRLQHQEQQAPAATRRTCRQSWKRAW